MGRAPDMRAALLTLLLLAAPVQPAAGPLPPVPPPVLAQAGEEPPTDGAPEQDFPEFPDFPDLDFPEFPDLPDIPELPEAPETPEPEEAGEAGQPSVSLRRTAEDGTERTIRVVKTGDDAGGIFAICSPQEGEQGAPTVFVASERGEGGVQIFIGENVIAAPLAVVEQLESGDGRLEVGAGTARYLDGEGEAAPAPAGAGGLPARLARCEVAVSREERAGAVSMVQGLTRLTGQRLSYSEEDGVARVSGPIAFVREDEEARLEGRGDAVEIDVDRELTVITGNVELRDGERVSRAARMEYDDPAGVALLYGSEAAPAVSEAPGERLSARVLRYNLNSGEVEAVGGVSGRFEVGD